MVRFLDLAEYGVLASLFSMIYILGVFSESIPTVLSKYTTNEYKLSFEQIASTLMSCEVSQEKDFIKSLQDTVEYKFNSSGEFTLLLKDNGGVAVFR